MLFDTIKPYQYVAIRLPSDTIKVEQIIPNTTINLGKYGTFHTDSIISRPYHLTFELIDHSEQQDGRELRVVRAAEIHAETILEEAEPDLTDNDSTSTPAANQFDEYGLPTTNDKSNVNILDNPNNQKLTYTDIEALKSNQVANPKELIAKIMANNSQLDQKTAFSLAKYTLRKQKKYMKRFTVLPLDVGTLTDWMMNEKDFARIMEMRNETVGLIGSWANVHASGPVTDDEHPRCRYLVVDDTGGLMVAALAERMGILHHQQTLTSITQSHQPSSGNIQPDSTTPQISTSSEATDNPQPRRPRVHEHNLATSNTLTLVHANQQPNLSLLRYFSFDPNQPPSPSVAPNLVHPLHSHLSTLTWLQILHPENDATYAAEPPIRSSEQLANMKANHRSTYYRKRRRWQRTKEIVDRTRQGTFDGLIVASHTDPTSICRHLVPLLRGGAQVVVYSPHIEPLMELSDVYSTARRTAYIQHLQQQQQQQQVAQTRIDQDSDPADTKTNTTEPELHKDLEAKFPVDPTLLLNFTIHHSTARPWQVLPGRTHPIMMGKGGAESGYVAVATRVIPYAGGVVQARGRQGRGRKRRIEEVGEVRREGKMGDESGEKGEGGDVEMAGEGDGDMGGEVEQTEV